MKTAAEKSPWKIMTGIFAAVAVFLVLAASGLFFFRHPLAEKAVHEGIMRRTGVRAEIRDVRFNFEQGAFRVEGLRLLNPPEYKDRLMLDIPGAYVDFDAGSYLAGNGRLERVDLHIARLWIVRDAEGRLNLEALKKTEGKTPVNFFSLRIDEIIFKDYTISREPIIQRFTVNIRKEYRDLGGFGDIGSVIGAEALGHAAFNRIFTADLDEFVQGNIFDPLTVANKVLTDSVGKVEEKAGQAVSAVTGGAGRAAGAVAGWVQAPFRQDEGKDGPPGDDSAGP